MALIKSIFPRHTIAFTLGTDNGYLSIDDSEPQWLNMHCVTWKGRLASENDRYCLSDSWSWNQHVKSDVRLVGEDGVLEPEVLRQKIRWFVRKSLPLPWQRRNASVLIAVKPAWSQEKQNELNEIVKAAIR